MKVEIGHAEVQFASTREIFDSVTILPGSVLRVANLQQKRSSFSNDLRYENLDHKMWALGERDVQYFPAESWVTVKRLEESGSLFSAVSTRDERWSLPDEDVVYRTVGDHLTWKEAEAALREELRAMGVTDADTVDDHCETLVYRGTTNFVPLHIPKYAWIRLFRARKRRFGSHKWKPGKRRGVVFSFIVSPEPQHAQDNTRNDSNFSGGLSLVKGSS